MTRTNASPDRDLFLAALVDDAADGQRVLWVGDARSRGPAALAERAESVVTWLVGRGARIYRLASGRKSLEQLFLEIIGEDERAG